MLGVAPAEALQPIRGAALQATQLARGVQKTGTAPPRWTPHITICYSICDRPAQPLIDALGFHLPSCDTQASALSLVIQHGPEPAWNWSIIDTIHLAARPNLARGGVPLVPWRLCNADLASAPGSRLA